jgi:hypothetical protein
LADLSDITTYIAAAVAAAVYPNGTGQPSIAAMDCRIYEGWPLPDKLDKDMAGLNDDGSPRAGGPVANVSVYPMPGTGVATYQIQDKTYVITPFTPGLVVVSVVGDVVTVSGQPKVGEYLTLICDDAVVLSQTGANTTALLAALAAQAQAAYPGASSTATTLTVPFGHSLVVRQGGVAITGKVLHRQRHSIMVTTWTPNQASRRLLAAGVDLVLKESIRIVLSDTSQATLVGNRTNLSDEQQASGIYRRDLIFDAEYATVQQFPSYVVTSVNMPITKVGGAGSATATAII